MIKHYADLVQGSDEWIAARCGLITASEVKHILTPTLKTATNEKSRSHLWELAAQRISRYVEPHYISDDMLRGYSDEVFAREVYSEKVAPIDEMGFITNDEWGFTLGYSPDGLVGADGLVECKSRRQKYHVETVVSGEIPAEHVLQLQAGLLVTGRAWIDYVSYCGGLPMIVIRAWPDEKTQAAIIEAAQMAEERIGQIIASWRDQEKNNAMMFPTERKTHQEMML
jgi:predicted phage-related endonuclease